MGCCVSFSVQMPLGDILSGCWNCGAQHVKYVWKINQNLENIGGKLEILDNRKNDVLRMVQIEEEGKGKKRLNEVAGWLNEVEKTISTFESLRADISRCSTCSLRNVHKLGKTLEKLAEKMEVLKGQTFSVVATQLPPSRVNERYNEPPIGATSTVCEVWNHIKSEQVGFIGLYGMGGVGKTTILTEINNKLSYTSLGYDLVIWVTVSQNINISEILNRIGSHIGRDDQEWNGYSQDDKASDIFKALNRKQFVLLLDDLWERVDLKKLGIPVPNQQNHSKVVFTCRSEHVCGLMGAQAKVRVKCLSPKDAWDLFSQKVGQSTIDAHQDIHELAVKVCQKCDGLPLMLNTLGLTMSSKRTPSEWRFILNRLMCNAKYIPLMEEMVLSNLKLSYDSLENETIKSRFLYLCFVTLSPAYLGIHRKQLILQWYANGLLKDLVNDDDNYFEVLDCGYTIFSSLQSAGLFDAGLFDDIPCTLYRMHDVIIEMGRWISQGCSEHAYKKFLSDANIRLSDKIYEEAERLFLCGSDIKELINPPDCRNLSTLVLFNNPHMGTISDDFFNFMPKLRVLSLSGCKALEMLPIGICTLKNLRSLDIMGTSIKMLPDEIQELTSLRILRLPISMEQLPVGINRFKELRYIEIVGNYNVLEIRLLEELESLNLLENLTVSLNDSSGSFRFFITSTKLLKRTSLLELAGLESLTENLDISFFQSMECLESVYISHYSKLEFIFNKKREGSVRLKMFSSIVFVSISGCSALQDVSDLLISSPNLKYLIIRSCTSMKAVVTKEVLNRRLDGISVRPFERLRSLTLDFLPSLEYICPDNLLFPFLHLVLVLKCRVLQQLPFTPSNARHCSSIHGERRWWDGLAYGGRMKIVEIFFLAHSYLYYHHKGCNLSSVRFVIVGVVVVRRAWASIRLVKGEDPPTAVSS